MLVIALLSTGIARAIIAGRSVRIWKPGVRVEIPINIEDVVDLYGIDIELKFDPAFWEFEDADPSREGIQPAIGTFLDPGVTLYNEIYPEEGRVWLVLTQLNPSEAKSGSGTIMVLYAKALKTGTTKIEVEKVELATREGLGIEVEGVDGEISISAQAPEVTTTAIPVIDPQDHNHPNLYPQQQPIPPCRPAPSADGNERSSDSAVSEPVLVETPEQSNQVDETRRSCCGCGG